VTCSGYTAVRSVLASSINGCNGSQPMESLYLGSLPNESSQLGSVGVASSADACTEVEAILSQTDNHYSFESV